MSRCNFNWTLLKYFKCFNRETLHLIERQRRERERERQRQRQREGQGETDRETGLRFERERQRMDRHRCTYVLLENLL